MLKNEETPDKSPSGQINKRHAFQANSGREPAFLRNCKVLKTISNRPI